MTSDLKSAQLDHEKHLLLDQPLLRLPNELARHNLKTAQIQIKATQDKVTDIITSSAKLVATAQVASIAGSSGNAGGNESHNAAEKANTSLDQAINRLQGLKRKLSALNDSTRDLHQQSQARVRHLEELYQIPGLADVKYEDWSRVRLDRLLVDYLLRMGYVDSARSLAKEKGIEDLVDCDAFAKCGEIERSLRVERKLDQALAWSNDHKATMKKMGNNGLEYELRLQQFIELARQGHGTGDLRKFSEARTHALKYLGGHPDMAWKMRLSTLLAIPPGEEHHANGMLVDSGKEVDPYNKLYSPARWHHLANLFIETHHNMFQLPQSPLLHMALTAGLSALKTPACHSVYISPSSGLNSTISSQQINGIAEGAMSPPLRDDFESMDGVLSSADGGAALSLTSSVCPICSTELNKLSKHLPFAHHGKSHVEHDPVVLPNGRIYGRERLELLNDKLGTPKGWVKDPVELGKMYRWDEVGRAYFL